MLVAPSDPRSSFSAGSGPGGEAPGGDGAGAADVPPSFERLYDEQAEFVYRSLLRLGVREAEADDALQEVFLVVHRRLDQYVGHDFLRTWLFRIALHVAQHVRRSQRRAPEPLDADSLPEERTPGPWRLTELSDRVRLLHALLETLDEDKRTVFILAELEQMTMPQIAAALGINLNTAYARLRAARLRFDEALARHRARQAGEVGE